MKFLALSIRQPYAERILRGTKRSEFRSRRTRLRGFFFIHAAQRTEGMHTIGLPTGAIVGIVRLSNCVGHDDDWTWRLANPARLRKPVPMKGALSFFRVPGAVLRRIPKSIQARVRRDPLRVEGLR